MSKPKENDVDVWVEVQMPKIDYEAFNQKNWTVLGSYNREKKEIISHLYKLIRIERDK